MTGSDNAGNNSTTDEGKNHKNNKKTEQHHDLSNKGQLPGVDEDLLKPLYIANKIADYPCSVCCCCFLFVIILTVLDGLVFELSDEEDRTWFVESSRTVKDYDTWTLASDALSDSGGSEKYITPQTQQESDWTIQLLFELNDYNTKIDKNNINKTNYWILTPENLEIILKYEEDITKYDKKWINTFCYAENVTTFECSYDSIARDVAVHFDYDFDSMTTESIRDYVWYIYQNAASPGTIESAFNEEFSTTNQTYVYRSFLKSAMPITTNNTWIYMINDGNNDTTTYASDVETNDTLISQIKRSKYRNDAHKDEDQEDKYTKWVDDYWQDITVKHEGKLKKGDLRIIFFELTSFNAEFNVLLTESMVWVLGAIIGVLFWMTVHLQSLFLSVTAIIQILFSFPAAYFIYGIVFQIEHFDTLSTLIIFVLLGVGADDVFVFTDAWRQSTIFVEDKTDLRQRMSFAYRRAAKAMLVTQTTTFFAFIATSTSTIMPISGFGLWAAAIVLCNYVLVITMYPALLIIHHKYIRPCERRFCCCCCSDDENESNIENNKHTPKKATPQNKDEQLELTSHSKIRNKVSKDNNNDSDDDDDDDRPPAIIRRQSTVEELAVQYGCVEEFFAITWFKWINTCKYVIIALFVVLFGLAIWRATELEEQNEQEEWFDEDHYMAQTLDFFDNFASSEETDLVYVVTLLGAKGVNRKGTDPWDATDYGKIKWDDSFDLSTNEAQEYLYTVCMNLTTNDMIFQATSVSCPLFGFKTYLESIGETFPYIASTDAEEQFDLFAEMMHNFTESNYATGYLQDKLLYVQTPIERSDERYYVRYIAIGMYTSLRTDADLGDQRDAKDDWYDWRKDTFINNDDCPEGISYPIMSALYWCWITTNEAFVTSAFQGIGIALPLAFIVLILSTQNILMAIFATFDIVGVMACELAVMEVAGWQFGVSESVSIVIIIGFSVDYVVHLANAYLESSGGIRSERTSFALLTMGISVVSGAVTTFIGGIFLIFPSIVFFQKMGILIVSTIAFSLSWSMLFFVALLCAFGPEYEFGNISCFKRLNDCICRRKDEKSGSIEKKTNNKKEKEEN